jgi:TetR/AcrR family transcriptional regulator, transcriptional repressor for nem operon
MSSKKSTRKGRPGQRPIRMPESATPVDRREKPETRCNIIMAARYLFWERGFEATSVSDILQRSGVQSGSFYYFFESKKALLGAVLQSYLQAFDQEVVAPIFQATTDPLQRIFGILNAYRHSIEASKCAYGCPIGRLALEIDSKDKEVFSLIRANFSQWTKVICECLQATETPSRNLDYNAISRFILVIMEGAVMQTRVYGDVSYFDSAVSQLRDYLNQVVPGVQRTARRG